MLKANLYVDRIDIAPYLTPEECRGLGGPDCAQVAARLLDGSLKPEDWAALSPARRQALSLAVRALEILPVVQSLELPRPVPPDLFEINEPGPDAPAPGHRQQRIHPGGGHRAPGPDHQPILPAAGGYPGRHGGHVHGLPQLHPPAPGPGA